MIRLPSQQILIVTLATKQWLAAQICVAGKTGARWCVCANFTRLDGVKFVVIAAAVARNINPDFEDYGRNDGCNCTADPKNEQRLPDWESNCENAADDSSNAIANCDD